jgi:hypothetical protein
MTEVAQILALPFSTAANVQPFRQNTGGATFWALLSQTHLVALLTFLGHDQEMENCNFLFPREEKISFLHIKVNPVTGARASPFHLT